MQVEAIFVAFVGSGTIVRSAELSLGQPDCPLAHILPDPELSDHPER